MTKELRLIRGKENFERGRFLDNKETLEYIDSMKAQKPKEAKKDAPSTK